MLAILLHEALDDSSVVNRTRGRNEMSPRQLDQLRVGDATCEVLRMAEGHDLVVGSRDDQRGLCNGPEFVGPLVVQQHLDACA